MTLKQIFSLDTLYILAGCIIAYYVFIKFLKNQVWAWKHADCLPMIPQDCPEAHFADDFSCLASMMGKASTRNQMKRYFDRIYELQEKYQGFIDNYTLLHGIDRLLEIYDRKQNELQLT